MKRKDVSSNKILALSDREKIKQFVDDASFGCDSTLDWRQDDCPNESTPMTACECIHRLLLRGDVTPSDVIEMAIVANKLEIVKSMLDVYGDENEWENYGFPLTVAITVGNLKVVRLLIEYGCDAATEVFGKLPIILANQFGHIEIVRYLVHFHEYTHPESLTDIKALNLTLVNQVLLEKYSAVIALQQLNKLPNDIIQLITFQI